MIEYLRPQNPAALFVVWTLWALFLSWCLLLARRASHCRRAARTASAISALMPALAEARRDLESRRASGEIVDPAPRFRSNLEAASLDPAEPASRLAGAIFSAAVAESRLEPAELLAQLERSLLSSEPAIRACLSAFLVMGLLGTLLGLAESLVSLSKVMAETKAVASTLRDMIQSLKGAFAPSISGAIASVLGSFLYSAHLYFAVRPALLEIRAAALESWIPSLCLTAGQKIHEAADRAVRHAIQVVEAADRIDRDTTRLREAVSAAASSAESYATHTAAAGQAVSRVAQSLDGAVGALTTQVSGLSEASHRWAAFEGEISGFYNASTQAQKTVVENQAAINQQLELQTRALERTLGEIGRAAENLHAPVADAASRMGAAAAGFGSSIDQVSARFAAAMETQAAALKQAHTEELEQLKRALSENSDRVRNLGAPFRDAAAQMIDTSQNLWKQSLSASERAEAASREQLALLRELLDRLSTRPSAPAPGPAAAAPLRRDTDLDSFLREQSALSKSILSAMSALMAPRREVAIAAAAADASPNGSEGPEWQMRSDPVLYSTAMEQLAETRAIAAAIRTLNTTAADLLARLDNPGAPVRRTAPLTLTTINSHL